jgi:Cd(II)/Pb(II)-responsive transcriptional regulator
MRIGEIAAQAGCDVQTVRYYEREGLLESPNREPSGYRSYAQAHLDRLQFIRRCRSLDVSLTEIRRLLDYSHDPRQSCDDVNALVDDHIRRVKERIESLRSLERQLISLRSECTGEDAGTSCRILAAIHGGPVGLRPEWLATEPGRDSAGGRDI